MDFSRSCSGSRSCRRGWNDRLNIAALQLFAQPTAIERLVADQGETIDAGQHCFKGGDVVALPRQQHEADQIAERVGTAALVVRPPRDLPMA